jgi:hypothetical protein
MTDDDDMRLNADAGTAELFYATTAVNSRLEELADDFPGATVIAVLTGGGVYSLFVEVSSRNYVHMAPAAMTEVHKLAQAVGRMDEALVSAFQAELDRVLEKIKIEAEIAAIRRRMEHGEVEP